MFIWGNLNTELIPTLYSTICVLCPLEDPEILKYTINDELRCPLLYSNATTAV